MTDNSFDTLTSTLIQRYKADPESVYNTWFVGSAERMKAFRAIRRGVKDTVDAIAAGTFGNDYRGSPLEVVLMAISFPRASLPMQYRRHRFFVINYYALSLRRWEHQPKRGQ